ncbi:swarming motility protein SwrB [Halolactibacillus alkaliphilus]|uniref:Swarming motility protein SwrB n=1 Tax=Halolactibacillus alkaliphilus TaxID=442899 RepID=A0A511WXF4_9BACI|nr:hypothetical protein [Halolactibacillus alkaliphilus]GEN55805.1 swarming motility protein SwrB [Halolactibacillus alkaliphilus]GGN64862.1 swarming motility protein SwrB [Halolactibacillus alkaliphilus]SFO64818.1 hypothetical protein SAMN05720591_102135 [Halolactibacillus alkaliphilus]
MEYLLIFFSFLLHVLTFIVLRHYYLKQQRFEADQHKFQSDKKELEQLLMSYLIEIKEENDRLVSYIAKSPQRNKSDFSNDYRTSKKQDQYDDLEQQSMSKKDSDTTKENNNTDYIPLVDEVIDKREGYEKSYQAEIISRYEQGQTTEAIAKALDRGKTEVELIIKFHKK